jgi:hypothetical protein
LIAIGNNRYAQDFTLPGGIDLALPGTIIQPGIGREANAFFWTAVSTFTLLSRVSQ